MRRIGLLLLVALLGCSKAVTTSLADAGTPDSGPRLITIVPGALDPLVLSVWSAGPDDLWFAGGSGGDNGGLIAHFDGSEIRRVSTPPGPVLWWLFGLDSERIWAVGAGGRMLERIGGIFFEQAVGLDPRAVLWGIWASAPDDLWAVGGSTEAGGPKGLVLRSRGDGLWRAIRDPAIPTDQNLFKVWGSAANDVHIVGDGGTAIHFDGQRFTRLETGFSELLFTVHGRAGGGPVLAVGGLLNGIGLSFAGGKWSSETLPGGPGLNGVFVGADGLSLAGGLGGRVLERSADGRWSDAMIDPDSPLENFGIHAVTIENGNRWAVGGKLQLGHGGVIATDRRPLPALIIQPLPAIDAGPPPPDASIADAELLDLGPLDASDAGPLPGPGLPCTTGCSSTSAMALACLAVALDSYHPFCLHACSTPADCGDYPGPACCMAPGPQTVETYCVPADIISMPCP